MDAIAQRFEILPSKVLKHKKRFEGKLKEGSVVETKTDLDFWTNVKHEAEGAAAPGADHAHAFSASRAFCSARSLIRSN